MKYHRFANPEERLKDVFERGFSARDIASALASFDAETPSPAVRKIMSEEAFQLAGVRVRGQIAGFVDRDNLDGGTCGDHLREFSPEAVVGHTASLTEVVTALEERERIFVSVFGEVGGLITRSDLEKPPVRMWLFGYITLIEMQMALAVDSLFPNDAWRERVTESRLAAAEKIQHERARWGQQARLADCLQFSDKAQILLGVPEVREELGIPSRRKGLEQIRRIESLRNNLAHSQGIVSADWPTIVGVAQDLDATLKRIGLTGDTSS